MECLTCQCIKEMIPCSVAWLKFVSLVGSRKQHIQFSHALEIKWRIYNHDATHRTICVYEFLYHSKNLSGVQH